MERLRRLVAVLGVASAVTVAGSADPAFAHKADFNSYWSCAATRSSADITLDDPPWTHTHVITPTAAYTLYGCTGVDYDFTIVCHWTATRWWNGVITNNQDHDCAPIGA